MAGGLPHQDHIRSDSNAVVNEVTKEEALLNRAR
jgi:hypothetical protein